MAAPYITCLPLQKKGLFAVNGALARVRLPGAVLALMGHSLLVERRIEMEKGVYVDERFLAKEIGSSGLTKEGNEILFVRVKKQFFTANPEAKIVLVPGVLLAIGHVAQQVERTGKSYPKLGYLAALEVHRISTAPNGDWLIEGYRDTHYRREFV